MFMATKPLFKSLTNLSELSYYGQEGVTITLLVDDTIDNLITVEDANANVIGTAFHKANTGTSITLKVFPKVSGTYNILAYSEDVTLSNRSSNEVVDSVFFKNLKSDQVSIPQVGTKSSFIDMNFWFYKGTRESDAVTKMIEDTTSGVGGYNTWDDFQESQFIPEVFSSSNIFKLLYSDVSCDASFIDIHHKIKKITLSDLAKLPISLKYSLDTQFAHNSFYVASEDASDTLPSILIDPVNELIILNILRDSKKFTYSTDVSIVALPMDEALFLSTYFSVINSLTPLAKLITLELYYLHYDLDDAFVAYQGFITLIQDLKSYTSNKDYALMCILYAYTVMNKVLDKKVLNVTENAYTPDFWSND